MSKWCQRRHGCKLTQNRILSPLRERHNSLRPIKRCQVSPCKMDHGMWIHLVMCTVSIRVDFSETPSTLAYWLPRTSNRIMQKQGCWSQSQMNLLQCGTINFVTKTTSVDQVENILKLWTSNPIRKRVLPISRTRPTMIDLPQMIDRLRWNMMEPWQ